MKKFGQYIKELRIKNQITLREFCKRAGLDPSNWSKIERGINAPPKSKEALVTIAKALNLTVNSAEYNQLFDYAMIDFIPAELAENTNVLEKLPLFFRTARGEKPTEEELNELIRLIKQSDERD
ncbi:MAG: helix-turn-helix transcriptional regulator [Bacteroidales bacterium]|nr:helix-turn-helix transcriptional regulator [Bacteroidales bacterium]